jgi:hypothetical protein
MLGNNYSHYSYLAKRMPLSFTNGVQNSGAALYFNPLIPLKNFAGMTEDPSDSRKIKYGVI